MEKSTLLTKEQQENLIKELGVGWVSQSHLIGTQNRWGSKFQIQILVTRDEEEFLDEE